MNLFRWKADIHYRTNAGINVVSHDIVELDEIADIVERGPDWNTIKKMEITLQLRLEPDDYTVEQSLER